MERPASMTEVRREVYGHDGRATNKHSERVYRAQSGGLYHLSRCLDGCPPFFEAYGPYRERHCGVLPRLSVNGEEYWGDGWTWGQAERAFFGAVSAIESQQAGAVQ
jgi:hypothetical protein